MPEPHHLCFYRLDALSDAQPTMSSTVGRNTDITIKRKFQAKKLLMRSTLHPPKFFTKYNDI